MAFLVGPAPIVESAIDLAYLIDFLAPTAAFHAFTAGTVGTMVIGVMTRVGLGHTGRPLMVPPAVTLAYCLVMFGALVRIFGALLAAELPRSSLLIGGSAWAAATRSSAGSTFRS